MNAEEILFTAGRLRRPHVDTRDLEAFQVQQPIVLKLIEMRKAGLLRAVYCDCGKLHIALPSTEIYPVAQSITWAQALNMAEEFERQRVERKPPVRAEIRTEAKTKKCRQ